MNVSNAIATIQPAALAPVQEWSRDQIDLIKRTVAENATDDELKMFMHVAAKAGLDPLQKQIWFVKRKQNSGTRENPKWEDRVTIQAGVDGLQARALRMPDCKGVQSAAVYESDDFVFDMREGQVVRHQGNPFKAKGQPIGAWAIVTRDGKSPFVALVRFSEYVDERSFLWKGKPAVMIEKVARSTALRRAYPDAFGGIYDPAEMGKDALKEPAVEQEAHPAAAEHPIAAASEVVDVKVEPVVPAPASKPAPPPVLSLWNRMVKDMGKEKAKEALEAASKKHFGEKMPPSPEWTQEQVAAIAAIVDDIPF